MVSDTIKIEPVKYILEVQFKKNTLFYVSLFMLPYELHFDRIYQVSLD